MKYLTNKSLSLSFVLEQINNDKFNQYKKLTKDQRLWYKDTIYNYDNIVNFLIEIDVKLYKDIILEIRKINKLLFENKIPLLDEYHVHKSFVNLQENNK